MATSGDVGAAPNQPSSIRGRMGSATVGVLTVIEEEFREVQAELGANENIADSPYFVRQLDKDNSYDVVLRNLGDRGNEASALGTRALMEAFRPPYVLLVGIGGGVKDRDGTQLGDVVVPVFIEGYEMRKLSDGARNKKRAIARDHPGYRFVRNLAEPMKISQDWLGAADQGRRPDGGGDQPKVILGPLIFGEKILGDDEDEYQRAVLNEFDNAVAVDMESGGVGRAIYESRVTRHYNPIYLVVRGISDLTNEAANNEMRAKWKPYAAHVAAAFTASAIKKVLEWN